MEYNKHVIDANIILTIFDNQDGLGKTNSTKLSSNQQIIIIIIFIINIVIIIL